MNKTVIVLLVAAIALAVPSAWAAKKKTVEEALEEAGKKSSMESQKTVDDMMAGMAREREAGVKAMEDYWDAQPDAPAVLPGKFLETLRKLPWPDVRPVPKEKYFTRPEIKIKAEAPADGEEDDPLLAGSWKKERDAKKDLKALRKESDDARFAMWLRNLDYFAKALDGCKTGATEGAERVKIMGSALVFIKEGEPEFHLTAVAEEGVKVLKKMEAGVKELASELYRQGQYIPDHKDLNMAEKISGRMSFSAGDPLTEKEKQRYYKVADRFARLDPRAPDAAAQGAPLRYAAGGGAKDAKWEEFLKWLVGRCNKTISGLNLMAAQPSEYPALIAKVEKELNAILASFPPGWQKNSRAKWAHGWFSAALEKAGKAADPGARGQELFRALNDFEAGLGE